MLCAQSADRTGVLGRYALDVVDVGNARQTSRYRSSSIDAVPDRFGDLLQRLHTGTMFAREVFCVVLCCVLPHALCASSESVLRSHNRFACMRAYVRVMPEPFGRCVQCLKGVIYESQSQDMRMHGP